MASVKWIAAVLLFLGGPLCCINFYLSFLRYPFFLFSGGKKEEYRWVSGIPFFGSFIVAGALWAGFLWENPWCLATTIILIIIDTGGIHWFVISMILAYRQERADTKKTLLRWDTKEKRSRQNTETGD